MEISCVDTHGDAPRAGHAAVWHRGAMYAFGGIPNWERYETEEPELRCPRGCEYAAMAQWRPTERRWRQLASADYPKSRHGHVMIAHGTDLWIIGGHNWAFAGEAPIHELVFSTERREFRVPPLLIPNRFAASCCPVPTTTGIGTQAGGGVRYLLFGGLDESREPCNDLLTFDLARNVCFRQATIGTAPPPQFKGGMVLDREGRRAFVFDGYTESAVQKVHMLTPVGAGDSFVWRAVCSSAPIVRFAAVPVYGGDVVALIGGMERRGRQRRVDAVHFFSLRDVKWSKTGSIEGFAPRTAHTVVAVPARDRAEVGGSLISYGGCVELDDTANNRGTTVGSVDVLQVQAPTLKYLAALTLLRVVPVEDWLPKSLQDRDDVLEELF
jgi:hypothetical protein